MSLMPGTMEPRWSTALTATIFGCPLVIGRERNNPTWTPARMTTGQGFKKGRWCAHVACGVLVQ